MNEWKLTEGALNQLSNEFQFPIAAFHHAHEAYLVPGLLKQAYGMLTYLTLREVAIVTRNKATLPVSLGIGNHTLTASFTGTAGFADSSSAGVALTTMTPAAGLSVTVRPSAAPTREVREMRTSRQKSLSVVVCTEEVVLRPPLHRQTRWEVEQRAAAFWAYRVTHSRKRRY